MAAKLEVSIVGASGLHKLNHFTGDGLFTVVDIEPQDKQQKKATWQTQVISGTLEPQWNETHVLEPWKPGDSLKCTVRDKGLMGSKVEGTAELPSEYFQEQGFEGTVPIEGLDDANITLRVVPIYDELPADDQQLQQDQYVQQQQFHDEQQYQQQAQEPQHDQHQHGAAHKLRVQIAYATGLHHLNHFCADKPYCVCEVVHTENHGKKTSCQTKTVTMANKEEACEWNEDLTLEPWHEGEALLFTVYDKGLLGSRTEAKATLPSEYIFPSGFQGDVPFEGLPEGANICVTVVVDGPATVGGDSAPANGATQLLPGAQAFAQAQPYQQMHEALPTNSRIVGEPRYTHTTMGPAPQIQQPMTFTSQAPVMHAAAPVTSTFRPAMTMSPYAAAPACAQAAPSMRYAAAPVISYGAAPVPSYAAAPVSYAAHPVSSSYATLPAASYRAAPVSSTYVQQGARPAMPTYGAPSMPSVRYSAPSPVAGGFNAIDKNGDGVITRAEFAAAMNR